MNLLRALIRDQRGYILSAEAVLLGTIGVAGATVGLSAVSKSLNEELTDIAFAFRSLDQSYCLEGETGCRSWTAGSCFEQQDVETSRAELGEWIAEQNELEESAETPSPRREKADRQESPKRRRQRKSRDEQPERRRESREKRDSEQTDVDTREPIVIRQRSTDPHEA